jgi:hypothetical protein
VSFRVLPNWRALPGWEAYDIAQNVAAGKGYVFPASEPWPLTPIGQSVHPTAWADPVYTLSLASLIHVFGDRHQFAAAIFNLILLAVALGLTYLVTERLLGPVAGLLALLLLERSAAFKMSVEQMNGTVTAATLVLLAALALLHYLKQPRTRSAVLLGLALGLVVLGCPAAQLFIVVAAAVAFWGERADTRRALAHGIAIAGVATLMVLPWSMRNYAALAQPIPVRDGLGDFGFWSIIGLAGTIEPGTLPAKLVPPWRAAGARDAVRESIHVAGRRAEIDQGFMAEYVLVVNPDYAVKNEAERDAWLIQQDRAFLLAHPLLSLKLSVAKLEAFARACGTLGLVVLLLAIIGGISSWNSRAAATIALWAAAFVTPFSLLCCSFARYRAPIEPLLTVLAVFALFRLAAHLPATWRKARFIRWLDSISESPAGPIRL